MRNNFHYGFGTRLTAVVLTMLMVLSLGGFVLRGQGVDGPEIFTESYGTPVPAETAAPEATAEPTDAPEALPPAPVATDAPAEETPVPEATETPVPETDSGTDTNTDTDTSEPAPTADPQNTPAPETEATAAPEGDVPADGPQMDEAAPIAGETAVLKITISGTAPSYMLVAENIGTAADDSWHFEFESQSNYFTPAGNSSTVQPTISKIEVSGNAEASTSNQKVLVTAFPVGGKVTVYLTADKTEPVTRFGVKIQNFFSDGTPKLIFSDDGSGKLTTEYCQSSDEYKDQLKFDDSSNAIPDPDPGNGTGVTYHLNAPDGNDAAYEQKDTDGKYILNIDDVRSKSTDFSNVGALNDSGQYKTSSTTYYFAGWNVSNANFTSYANITYPYVRIQANNSSVNADERADYEKYKGVKGFTANDKYVTGFRHVALNTPLDEPKPADLYAVWVEAKNSGLLGYTMTLKTESWTTAPGVLGRSGWTSSRNAPKFVVLDDGHEIGKSTLITAVPAPVDGYSFIAWHNDDADDEYKSAVPVDGGDTSKRPNAGNYYIFPGQTVYFGDTNDVFSLDAVWGKLTPPVAGEPIPYDSKTHTPGEKDGIPGKVALETVGGDDTQFTTDAIPTYTVTVKKDDKNYTEYDIGNFTNQTITTTDGNYDIPLPGVTEVGKYVYTITVTFTDQQDHTKKTTLETTAELTIKDEASLTYHFSTPGGKEDIKFIDTSFTASGDEGAKQYTYNVKQLQDAFTVEGVQAVAGVEVSTDKSNKKNLDQGSITVDDKYYYFAGWSKDEPAKHNGYLNVDYRVLDFQDDRQLGGSLTLVTTEKEEHLYAVWVEIPGLLVYRLAINGATLGDAPTSLPDGVKGVVSVIDDPADTAAGLGQTMLVYYKPGENTKDYLHISHGREYKKYTTITAKEPDPKDTGYSFITWHDNKVGDFVFPGKSLFFNTNSVYSIYAVWGRMQGANGRTYYNHESQKPTPVTLHIAGGNSLTAETLNSHLTATYTVTVTKNSAEFSPTDIASFTGRAITIGSDLTAELELPGVTDVGVYNYHVEVTFADQDEPGTTATPITCDVEFVVDPVLQVQVTKKIMDGEAEKESFEGSYEFTMTARAGEGLTVPGPITVASKEPVSFGAIPFDDHGTYHLTVSETPGDDPGMGYAGPQTFTVTVQDEKPYKIEVTDKTGLKSEDGGNTYILPLTFENEVLHGTLTFTKTVIHEVNEDAPEHLTGEEFTFLLKGVPAERVNGKSFTVEGTGDDGTKSFAADGTFEFTLSGFTYERKDGFNTASKPVTFENLPLGVTYTVTETSGMVNYSTDSPAEAELSKAAPDGKAEITNIHFPGALVIRKQVHDPFLHEMGAVENPFGEKFKFDVTVTRPGSEGTVVPNDDTSYPDTDGVYVVELSDKGMCVVRGLQDNDHYVITEESSAHYQPYYSLTEGDYQKGDTAQGDIDFGGGNKTAQVLFVNDFKSGDLVLRKEVTGDKAPSGREFLVDVELSNGGYDTTQWGKIYDLLQVDFLKRQIDEAYIEGVYRPDTSKVVITLRMANNRTLRLDDLPAGLHFQVTEHPSAGFTASYTVDGKAGSSGTIPDKTAGGATQTVAVITNEYKTGELSVTKVLGEGGNAYGRFTMKVTLSGEGYPRSGTYAAELKNRNAAVRADGENITSVTFSGGAASFALCKGETLTIKGLPDGIGYKVQEQGAVEKGYKVRYSVSGVGSVDETGISGTITAGETIAATVINTFGGGDLIVQKVLEGTGVETDRTFHFTVDVHDDSINGNRGVVVFDEGVAEFSIKGAGSVVIPSLQNGLEFTVTETEANLDGYTTTYTVDGGTAGSAPATGTIQEDKDITVTVTNHKDKKNDGGGGGEVSPPWDWPEAEATPTPSPSASPSPSPSPSAGPSPTPGGTPGPGETSQPFGTPQPTRKPGTTSQPFTPGSGGPTAPATGDDTAIAPWAALLALSMAGLAAVMIGRRKRRDRG